MVDFGFFASLEQYSPTDCLDQIRWAEAAGVRDIWVNDHFHPSFDVLPDGSRSDSGNCWSWMPAALERTDHVRVGTGMTSMLHRHHPGTVAHRLATMESMYPGRTFLGVATGEAMNESPLGYEWPSYNERAQRTAEALRHVRTLVAGDELDTRDGFWEFDEARLYTVPDETPDIYVGGWGTTPARMAGELADGFATVAFPPEQLRDEILPAVETGIERSDRTESRDDFELVVHIHGAYAESKRTAIEHLSPWKATLLPVFFEYDVSDPRFMREHGELVSDEALAEEMFVGTTPDDVIEKIEPYVELGADQILLQIATPDHEAFAEMLATEVFPCFE